MFFVQARYHRNLEKVPRQIRYISHREEGLPSGERRELFGIGERYGALRGDERAIAKAFAEDSKWLQRPAFFRFILTVDNRSAERFARLDDLATERVIREALQRTFRDAARDVQGVFSIHQHGGHGRPSHPHVHALLSPLLQNGAPIYFSWLGFARVRQRWEVEVLRALRNRERRFVRQEPERAPLTLFGAREPRARQPQLRFDPGRRRHGLGVNTLVFLRARLSRRLGSRTGGSVDAALRLLGQVMETNRNPEGAARRFSMGRLSRAVPGPMRNALRLVRGVASIGVRPR